VAQSHADTTQVFAADSLDGPNEDEIEELPGDVRVAEVGRRNPAKVSTDLLFDRDCGLSGSVQRCFTVMFSLRALGSAQYGDDVCRLYHGAALLPR
jgi:hypothetical protein